MEDRPTVFTTNIHWCLPVRSHLPARQVVSVTALQSDCSTALQSDWVIYPDPSAELFDNGASKNAYVGVRAAHMIVVVVVLD